MAERQILMKKDLPLLYCSTRGNNYRVNEIPLAETNNQERLHKNNIQNVSLHERQET